MAGPLFDPASASSPMRIFYAVDHEPFPGNKLWNNNLHGALVDLGHEVLSFDYDLNPFINVDPYRDAHKPFVEAERPKLESALLAQIRKHHAERPIDLFLSYFHLAFCRPEIVREIAGMGIPTANWYCNASFQFHLVEELAPAYDFCLVPEHFRLEDYRRAGANPIYCQEAANPTVYKPCPVEQEFDVTFVGARYGDRPDHIQALLDAGIKVRVWGRGWTEKVSGCRSVGVSEDGDQRPEVGGRRSGAVADGVTGRLRSALGWRWRRLRSRLGGDADTPTLPHPHTPIPPHVCGRPLSDEEMVSMYSRSRINLGFSSCGNTHRSGERILQVRLRDFEVPMSCGFYMVEYMEELESFFKIGEEIVCYHGVSDLVDKVRYYLDHADERERIRKAGHRRCLRDHTWQKRLSTAFKQMGLA